MNPIKQTFLFRIDKIRVGKDRYINDKPKQVTEQWEMEAYLDGLARHANGDIEDEKDPSAAYYFLTAKEPNGMVIADMLDRSIGKVRQVVGLEGSTPGSPVEVLHLNDDQYGRIIAEEVARIAADPTFGTPTPAATGPAVPVERTAEAGTDSAESGEGTPNTV